MEGFNVFSVIKMLGGLALFLYGMRIMGDGLKSGSSGAFQKAIEKVTNNPFMGFLVGLLVTAVIQSSTATIVIVSGLVGAGVITLYQSIGIIIGANVGTTATGQILRLLDVDSSGWTQIFKPETLAPIAAVIGILCIMALKNMKNSNTVGTIAIGFGILFTGLINMTAAVDPLSSSPEFGAMFTNMSDVPILGFVSGTVVAFILQSSSASVGILQSLSMGGQLTFSSIYAILFGIYLGDCVTTAIVCSIGAKADAKRTGVIHIMFNLIGAVIVFAVLMILHNFTGLLDNIWNAPITSGGIANVNTIFKFAGALILLPACGAFERASKKIVKNDKISDSESKLNQILAGLDRTLYRSPAIALSTAFNTITSMSLISEKIMKQSRGLTTDYNEKTFIEVDEGERHTDILADRTSDYLVGLSHHISNEKSRSDQLNYYMKVLAEFERIGDLALNIAHNTKDLDKRDIGFSDKAHAELDLIFEALEEVEENAQKAFSENSVEFAKHIEPIEEVIDDMGATLRENHLNRLRDGKCNVDAGFIFLDILLNVERISDQCSNIGVYVLAGNDEKVANMQHDYLRMLHQGKNEQYNNEYNERKAYYFNKLDEIYKKFGDE